MRTTFGGEPEALDLLARANEGVLHLDEIADMDPNVQAMLLSVLQERRFLQQGAGAPTLVDFLAIIATNKSPDVLRHDFRQRFEEIELAPLRKRREDIGVLALELIAQAKFRGDPRVSSLGQLATVLDFILGCELLGNMREMERLLLNGLVNPSTLEAEPPPPSRVELKNMAAAEVEELLEKHGGKMAAVEREVGCTRQELRSFVAKHRIKVKPGPEDRETD